MKNKWIKFIVEILLIWLVGTLLVVLLQTTPNNIERFRAKYLPIFDEFEVSSVYHDDDYNHDISGAFRKVHYQIFGIDLNDVCKFNSITADMLTPGGWKRVGEVQFFDQPPGVETNRPSGKHAFGIWKILTGDYPSADIVKLHVVHTCLWFYNTRTTVEINLDEVGKH